MNPSVTPMQLISEIAARAIKYARGQTILILTPSWVLAKVIGAKRQRHAGTSLSLGVDTSFRRGVRLHETVQPASNACAHEFQHRGKLTAPRYQTILPRE